MFKRRVWSKDQEESGERRGMGRQFARHDIKKAKQIH